MVQKTRSIKFGRHQFRIRPTADGWEGIIVGGGGTRFAADTEQVLISKLQDQVLMDTPEFVGFDGARTRFLNMFPGGFEDSKLVDGPKSEIGTKRDVVSWVAEMCPLENALVGAVESAAIFAAFKKSGMVDHRHMSGLKAALEGPKGPRLIEIFARFAAGEFDWACGEFGKRFDEDGLRTWPILTHMAFFWRPDQHAFMRPTAARAFARGVGHRLDMDYSSAPEPNTYALYLDLLDQTRSHIADLEPRDYIDLQSFVWVVTKYPGHHAGIKDTS